MPDADQPMAEYRQLAQADDLLPLVCSLTQKAYRAGRRIVIYADETRADVLDGLLWSFRQNSFIPHGQWDELEDPLLESAIIVSRDPDDLPDECYDVLIVVRDGNMPGSFERFERVQDFAPSYDLEAQEAARSRYAACKDAGFSMRFVPLKENG